ncbi:MAG: hypothetical protein A2846_00160 [Candidatus Doudnabacteria bacterium RIFCSPHIGHO2_01_FULL_49_9]|uniref:Uncharacterized protein n=1 Tax=Candidatus Doudnabacteria bacterium RIFCSPHIGHO2_01_FULL_49_9 TaxID=1817827 RepID=A0A1F5P244_9BACT|nr:MAG: hypothetical protein A2846_00160 [Candidatus Doudnabacteria bacterium RIFCSPHIGHO2_01_FULL_49_9]
MKPVINPSKQKIIVVAVVFLVALFGLEAASSALGLFQIEKFFLICLYIYLFLVFWQSFIFDLHLKNSYTWQALEKSFWVAFKNRFRYMAERHHFLHYQNYLILPAVIYWSAVVLLYLNPFDSALKHVLIGGSAFLLATATWYLKTVFYDHHGAHHTTRQIIFVVKLLASFLTFAAVFGYSLYFGIGLLTFSITVFGLAFLLFHQAFFQHHYDSYKTVEIFSVCGIVIAWTAALVNVFWNVNYFSGATVITAVYIACWGIVQHKYIDQNLTREIVYEYLSVLFVVLVLLVSMTNFGEKLPPPDENRNEGYYHEAR